jgi:RimJ/RimL family protein N-acetyltransferase/heme-degrading monooxygenase HmoA
MILETATLTIKNGQTASFEEAFQKASPLIRSIPGYCNHELRRCIEKENTYLLLVNWKTLEDHTVGFRQSKQYQEWKTLLHHFYDPFPEVMHYDPLFSFTNDPTKPAPATLTGKRIQLIPLVPKRDADTLFKRSNGEALSLNGKTIDAYDSKKIIWEYLFDEKPNTVSEMETLLQRRVDTPRALCFCVIDIATQTPIGVCNYANHYPDHLKIELGGIWYSPIAQGTGANTEAVYLLLDHAFQLGIHRVEWKCDARNSKSRHVAEKLGFTFEGIQEKHLCVKGYHRDTAWFRMLSTEWPEKKQRLLAML